MINVIIVHGLSSKEEYYNEENQSPSNSHWFPWLQKQLSLRGILTQTPEMPRPYDPIYSEWAKVFEQFEVNEGTSLIGYSMGGGFILRWLSEHPDIHVDKVVLVAPWIDTEKRLTSGFFDFALNSKLKLQCKKMTIIYSDNDMKKIDLTIDFLKNTLKNVDFVEMKGMGHFHKKFMGKDEFPKLLNYL